MKTVMCLSGGIDSSVTAATLVAEGHDLIPLFFDYGQAALIEEAAASRALAHALALPDLNVERLDFWRHSDHPLLGTSSEGAFFLPMRNAYFALQAFIVAEQAGAHRVAFGFIRDTNPDSFPDATEEFLADMNDVVRRYGPAASECTFVAPNVRSWKRDMVAAGVTLGVPLELTYSCWRGGVRCRTCDSCRQAMEAFAEASAYDSLADAVRRHNPYAGA